MELREYQKIISQKAYTKLLRYGIVYLAMEVRTGKTFTALNTCKLIKGNLSPFKVLFVTKKKAIKDIESQCLAIGVDATVINYESINKVDTTNLDVIIVDEAHSCGQYPKPSKRFKDIRSILQGNNKYTRIIFLSGTPSPESYSQLFHQFRISDYYSPFKDYMNFYKWAAHFVNVTKKYVSYGSPTNDYSDANKDKIDAILEPYFITYSQDQAGFKTEVKEKALSVEMKKTTYSLCNRLIKDDVVEGTNNVILADTPVKKQSKLHQIYSGTIKFEDGTHKILDDSKAIFIRDNFKGKKIAIFYKFIAEYELLRSIFTNYTTEPMDFNESKDRVFLGQIQSVREGINLSTGDCIIMFNIDFSAVSYWQGKDRLSEKNRTKDNLVYWLFSKGGIEEKIYKAVLSKKDYTVGYFKKDYEIRKQSTKQDNQRPGEQGLLFN